MTKTSTATKSSSSKSTSSSKKPVRKNWIEDDGVPAKKSAKKSVMDDDADFDDGSARKVKTKARRVVEDETPVARKKTKRAVNDRTTKRTRVEKETTARRPNKSSDLQGRDLLKFLGVRVATAYQEDGSRTAVKDVLLPAMKNKGYKKIEVFPINAKYQGAKGISRSGYDRSFYFRKA